MKTIGVIPSRWASTRLPGKSLHPICGRPLIAWVLERVQRARSLAEVLVATDDERIAAVVRGLGGTAIMTRADHPSGTDRVAEAARGRGADVVINIQGDEPLIEPDLIDRLARAMQDHPRWDMGTAAAPIRSDAERAAASVVKVVWDEGHRALYFSRSLIPHRRDADLPLEGLHWRHVGIYAYRRAFLDKLVATPPCLLERAEKLEQLRALHIGGTIGVVETAETGAGVDTPEDVVTVERMIRERGLAPAGA